MKKSDIKQVIRTELSELLSESTNSLNRAYVVYTKALKSFEVNATIRVKLGVILYKILEERKIEKNDEVIKELIEERASGFKDPDQYKQWIFSNEEQLKNIESIALEEQVTELISSEAKCEIEQLSFEEMMSMS